ncbi:MAG: zinc-binding dehydrogenase [Candidatus Marinimicrobia bacterium]|nr:zinc-binding dehydrogenase [Candidatus Neomarinimicrobiota bacterium]
MKAVQLIQIGQPLESRELDIPEITDGDVLVAIKAAGICHTDTRYRSSTTAVLELPRTLGHEIAGIVEKTGAHVDNVHEGDRVCLHYLVTCGTCRHCKAGREQFCLTGEMLGNSRNGGYAEYVSVPAENAFLLPDDIPFEHGAIMMCSSATSYHALKKARLQEGESVAIFGVGGLGMAAIQLARSFGASEVYAIDINASKLTLAEQFGAIPIDASKKDPIIELNRLTNGEGVDVALELIGLTKTAEQAIESLALFGRAALVGLNDNPVELYSYKNLISKEAEIIGVSDHLTEEFPHLIELVRNGSLDLSPTLTQKIQLSDKEINNVLDSLQRFDGENIRSVITL